MVLMSSIYLILDTRVTYCYIYRPVGMPTPSGAPGPLTVRAVVSGILIGSLLCCSNMYFGLQTGWVTMGSLQVCGAFVSQCPQCSQRSLVCNECYDIILEKLHLQSRGQMLFLQLG
jgi:OPT oligopeptide transporter protein